MAPSRRALHVKKGDVVKVIAGKDKGVEGKVIAVLTSRDRVIVEGVNRVKRHTKRIEQGGRGGTTGGIVTQEASIHVSNVMPIPDGEKVPTRVAAKRVAAKKTRADGSTYDAERSVRVSVKSGKEF
jgi:large subunit ribosomal protein L24